MPNWYTQYYAQTWYRNTYLVHKPKQIAKATASDNEWNNIQDSGCNFTCLAMIIGIDPARLASELGSKYERFFRSDRTLPARNLAGDKVSLVWDRNEPWKHHRSITVDNIWHPQFRRRASITIAFISRIALQDYAQAVGLVADMHGKGHHIICGTEDHSHLIAGTRGKTFFVWDPDDSEHSVEENLAGQVTLRQIFDDPNRKGRPVEFCEYECVVV